MSDAEQMRKFKRNLSNARREIYQAVERASKVDLLPGHVIEARRQAEAVRERADELVKMLEEEGAGD